MTAVYSYVFTDVLTNQLLGDMPVNGVTFDRALNKPGNFQGSINLDNDFIANDDIIDMTEKGKRAIYVYRDDQIVWGGIIWTRTYQSQAKALSFTAQTFESYAYRRIYRPVATVNYNENQCQIVQDLWSSLQSDSHSNVQVMPATNLPGFDVVRQVTVNPWDFRTYGDILDSITAFEDGCDWYVDYGQSSGVPSRQLVIGFPAGVDTSISQMIIDYPGNILNFFWTENANETATNFYATGDGDGADIKVGNVPDSNALSQGYLLTDQVNQYQGVTQQATINAHAAKDEVNNNIQHVKHQFDLKADQDPELGSFGLGDACRIMVDDARFTQPIDIQARIVGWAVTPSSSDSTELMSLVLQGDDTNA